MYTKDLDIQISFQNKVENNQKKVLTTEKKDDKISTVPLRNTSNKKTNKSTLTTEQRNTRSYICDGDIGRYLDKYK